MANVQLEHGHTRIANDFIDALLSQKLAGREWTILMAIVRLTWGWRKKSERISSRQLARMTGIERRNVRLVLAELRSRKILARRREGMWYRWGIVKDFDKWKPKVGSSITPGSLVTRKVGSPMTRKVGSPTTPSKERKKEIRGALACSQNQNRVTHLGEPIPSFETLGPKPPLGTIH